MISSPASARIEDLAFLVGSWRHESGAEVLEETWNPLSAGSMLGCTKHIREGQTRLFELQSIEPVDSGITMWVVLGRPPATMREPEPFHLVAVDGEQATFEHPVNDFPKRIIYERLGPKEMRCTLVGTRAGESVREEFLFRSR